MVEETKNNILSVALSNYDAPKIEEEMGKEYVTYGDDNEYFQYIEECYNGSTTNRAVINTISLMIYGKGLSATDLEGEEDKKWKKVEELFKPRDLRLMAMDLKKFGSFCFQVAYSKGGQRKVIGIKHHPVESVAKGLMDEQGNIKEYWYSADWTDTQRYEPKKIAAFGTGAQLELFYGSYMDAGLKYYTNVDYQAGLQYCKIEEEMSNFHINAIRNGFAPTIHFSFKGGVPTLQEQLQIESKIKQKWTGSSNASKLLLTFSDSSEDAPEFNTIDVPDAHNRFQFLSEEAAQKILTAHRVTSPMLLGIKDNTGLGNNADELITATQLFNSMVIRPFQDVLTDAISEVLAVNKIEFDLFFETLQPIEFTEDGADMDTDSAEVEKETGVDKGGLLDSVKDKLQLSADDFEALLRSYGRNYEEEGLDDYEEVEAASAKDEPLEVDYEKLMNDSVKLSAIQNSDQDTPFFKVRYRYVKGTSKTPIGETRQFCRTMLNLAAKGVVYRKEDILQMGEMGINGQFAHSGGKYNIFLYGGGVNCYHIWERVVFRKKALPDGKPYGGNPMQNVSQISVGEAKKKGWTVNKQPQDVTIAEIDKPNKGRVQ